MITLGMDTTLDDVPTAGRARGPCRREDPHRAVLALAAVHRSDPEAHLLTIDTGLSAPCAGRHRYRASMKPGQWLQGLFVIRDFGRGEGRLADDERPYGANMAFRRVLQRRPFDPNLGLRARESVRGDETTLIDQLVADGLYGVWVPTARVQHFIPAQRLTRAYLRDYFRGQGRTDVRREGVPPGRGLGGAPLWLYRSYWDRWRAATWKRLRGRTDWVPDYIELARCHGSLQECWRQRRRPAAAGPAALATAPGPGPEAP